MKLPSLIAIVIWFVAGAGFAGQNDNGARLNMRAINGNGINSRWYNGNGLNSRWANGKGLNGGREQASQLNGWYNTGSLNAVIANALNGQMQNALTMNGLGVNAAAANAAQCFADDFSPRREYDRPISDGLVLEGVRVVNGRLVSDASK